MKIMTANVASAAILMLGLVGVDTAWGQSCTGGKLCNGNYKIEDGGYSNPKHKDIMIVVTGVGGPNPQFNFAPNNVNENLHCTSPLILNGGESMSCTQPLDEDEEADYEIVTVGVIGGQFCENLRGLGPWTRVMSAAECTDKDCACFMVQHLWEVNDGMDSEYAEDDEPDGVLVTVFGPPSRGTGSGGSP